MSSNTFFIADTHFGHKKILEFKKEFRPFDTIEEHDETIIDNWNSVVSKHDVVYHLGDISWVNRTKTREHLSRLNGVKKLVLGNHDEFPTRFYLEFFTKIVSGLRFKNYLLTHHPVHPSELKMNDGRYTGNIHGHLHHDNISSPGYINVSCEQINLTPVSVEELKL